MPSSGVNLVDWGGQGKPFLLVHGMGANTHWWTPVVKRLAGIRAAALDLSGHGESDWTDRYTTQRWLEDIEAARRRLGWQSFTLAGHSLGGRLALEYAAWRPEQLVKVVAVDFLPEARRPAVTRIRQPYYDSADKILERFRLNPPGTLLSDEDLRALGRHCIRRTGQGWTWKFDWRAFQYPYKPVWDMLGYVRVPALVVRGENSTIMSRADLERVTRELQKGEAVEVPEAWHHVPLDCPKELAALLCAS